METGQKSLTRFQKVFFCLCLLLALGLRLQAAIHENSLPAKDAADYDQLAVNLAHGNGYRDADGNLTAWRPPLYPAFLAGIYKATQHNHRDARIAQALLSTLIVLLVGDWARILFGGWSTCWAALIAAVYPAFYAYSFGCAALVSETLYAFLLTAFFWGLFRYFSEPAWLPAALSGLALGLAILTRPVPLLLVFFLLGFLLLLKYPRRQIMQYQLILWGAVLLVLAPWTLRNYRVFGQFVPVSTMGGANFYLANHSGANGLGGSQGAGSSFYHGIFAPQEEKLHALGVSETSKSRYFFSKGIEFAISQPVELFKLILWKALLYMDPRTVIEKGQEKRRVFTWLYLLVFTGASLSWPLAKGDRKATQSILCMHLVFGYFLAIHAILMTSERYRFPTETILIVLSSFSFGMLSQNLRPWIRK